VRSQHDWGLLSGCHCHDLNLPGVWRHRVCHVADDLAGEALLAVWVDNRESDRVRGMCNDGKVAVVPTVRSAMQSVVVVVLLQNS
jgi:hypothetical protein